MAEELVLYVGSTVRELRERQYEHRCGDTGKNHAAGSKDIPDDCEWEIKLLEECSEESRRSREQYYYDTLKPFYNLNSPIIDLESRKSNAKETCKIYAEAHKDAIKAYKKEYFQARKGEINEKKRAYRQKIKNEII